MNFKYSEETWQAGTEDATRSQNRCDRAVSTQDIAPVGSWFESRNEANVKQCCKAYLAYNLKWTIAVSAQEEVGFIVQACAMVLKRGDMN